MQGTATAAGSQTGPEMPSRREAELLERLDISLRAVEKRLA
jgi:hypothetical protein